MESTAISGPFVGESLKTRAINDSRVLEGAESHSFPERQIVSERDVSKVLASLCRQFPHTRTVSLQV